MLGKDVKNIDEYYIDPAHSLPPKYHIAILITNPKSIPIISAFLSFDILAAILGNIKNVREQ